MPMKPVPPCRWPGCPNLQVSGGHGYCEVHIKAHRQEDARRRGSARQRGYTKHYEAVREWVLKRHPLCAICKAEGRLTAATITHHIKPLAEGGSNSASNLLPVCEACHERLHSKEGDKLLSLLEGHFF